jgi:putative salt-induced outer membrane protein YdiY
MHPRIFALAATALCAGLASSAGAQYARPVAISQHTESIAAPPAVEDQTSVNLAAGATLNGGNTEAYAANGGGRLGIIRHPHQFNLELLGTLGYARNATTTEVEQTSANVIGRARYDLFLSHNDALFIAVGPRRDTFAGLNIRLQNQVGYLRNLYFPAESHRLWTELGYDLTYDDFAEITTTRVETNPPGVIAELPMPPPPNVTITRTTVTTDDPGSDVVHSGRLFFGYTNTRHAVASVNLGVETLFDVEDGHNVRVNGTAEINSSLTERFKLGVQFRLLFDNVPVDASLKKYDTITALQLIYTYDSADGGPEAPSCPPCDCSADVVAARAACASAVEPVPAAPVEPVPPAAPVAPPPPPPAVEQPPPATP